MMSHTSTLLRLLQDVEVSAGELADGLDAGDGRAVRLPGQDSTNRLCTALAAAAGRSLRVLQALLSPAEEQEIRWQTDAPGSVAELQALLAAAFPDGLEWIVCARSLDANAPLPEAKRIACYAAPGVNEGHVVHVDAVFVSSDGPSTMRQVLIGKTELGLEYALAIAVLCASLIHFRESAYNQEGIRA